MARTARILVVEDNDTNRMIFQDLLVACGHTVLVARTAEESLVMARAENPDLILMDLQLPGMDGMEAVRCLKEDAATRAIPVVALTAHAMAYHRERALEAGCRDYITKPIRSREFRERVQAVLEGAEPPPAG